MKPKTVLGIIASPRRKNSTTLRLVEAVLAGAGDEGAATELVDLYTLKIKNCTACNHCFATGECALKDDFVALLDRLIRADGIVLGAPNYFDSVPGPVKTLFDRLSGALLSQKFAGKFACSVATAGGPDAKKVTGYMNYVVQEVGANIVGSVGASTGMDPEELEAAVPEARKLGRILVRSIRGEITYPDQDRLHEEKREFFSHLTEQGGST